MTASTRPRPVRRRLRISIGVIVCAAALAACGSTTGGAGPTPTTAATSAPGGTATAKAATFTLTVAAPLSKTVTSVAKPAVSSCVVPAAGPWGFTYTAMADGPNPFVTVDLAMDEGAATPAGSKDFRLDVDTGEDGALPVLFIDPLGKKSGSQGSTGTVTATVANGAAHIVVTGTAREKGIPNAGLNDLTFDLTCATG